MSSTPTTSRRLARTLVLVAGAPMALALLSGTASAGSHGQGQGKPTPTPSTSAQPLSNADRNGTGANPGTTQGCGSYCSTRDGSASNTGRGEGKAHGKPCAGCVGKADNKNPRGQAPSGPVDGNAGYECDRNQGIGQGNPAHTGCTSATTPSAILRLPRTVPTLNQPSTPVPVAAPQGASVAGQSSTSLETVSLDSAGAGSAQPTPSGLPLTGDRTGEFLLLSLILLSTGGGLMVAGRRT